MFGVAMQEDGCVDPSSQLFRANFIGVETGPMVSQVQRVTEENTRCLLASHTSMMHC